MISNKARSVEQISICGLCSGISRTSKISHPICRYFSSPVFRYKRNKLSIVSGLCSMFDAGAGRRRSRSGERRRENDEVTSEKE